VLNSVDVLGNITLDVVFASKSFVDANPKTLAAFLSALDEANEFIAKDVNGAADIFVRASKVKVSKDEVVEILKDPDTRFSATPNGVMNFADFMHRAGTIKVKAGHMVGLVRAGAAHAARKLTPRLSPVAESGS
jgi:NitT/TauT family transport system substrate-binding protein